MYIVQVFVREKINKSGSTSVQVVEKRSGKYVVVKTIGCATDQSVISEYKLAGQQYIDQHGGQMTLDLDEGGSDWFAKVFSQVKDIQLVGPELILGKLYDEIGFNQVPHALFRHLVLARIVKPSSKLKTTRYLHASGIGTYSVKQVYRYMDKLHKEQKELIERISYEHTLKVLNHEISIVFYDVTTIYFEAEKEDDLRIAGFSKDGKHRNPQILLGLLVSAGGYPLAYSIFKGNTYEGHTMMEVVQHFKQQFSLQQLVVVADAGLMTNKNVEELIENQYEFILGARIKNESDEIKSQIIDKPYKNGQSHVFDKGDSLRLIVQYSDKRAKKDKYNRQRGLQNLERKIKQGKLTKTNINNRGYNKYLTLKGNIDISIDYEKFEEDSKWDGLKGYVTNTELSSEDVLQNYGELWKIEKAFRISKTDLRVRPIYHRLERRIESHICISFAAYKLYKELERQLNQLNADLSVEQAIEIIGTIHGITLQHPALDRQKTLTFIKNQDQQLLLDLFKIAPGVPKG